MPRVIDFNQVISMDLKQFDDGNVLQMVDIFTRLIQWIVIRNKETEKNDRSNELLLELMICIS